MARNRRAKANATLAADTPGALEIPEDEQWRLVNQSGILGKASSTGATQEQDNTEEIPLGDEIFNAAILIIPFSFLLLMMEILIHNQYGKQPSLEALVDRMAPGVPILSVFIFYTTRYKRHRNMQLFLFVLSGLAGSRMIYLINGASWLVVMKQCPPLATIWIYTIVQLELGPASLSLLTVGSFVWWKGLKVIF